MDKELQKDSEQLVDVEFKKNGEKAFVKVSLAGKTLHVDTINPKSSHQRKKFCKAVETFVSPEIVNQKLMDIIDELDTEEDEIRIGKEIELGSINRPERIIKPDQFSLITIPHYENKNGKVVGRWVSYARWCNDVVRAPLNSPLNIFGHEYIVDPVPPPPNPSTDVVRWSIESRQALLGGDYKNCHVVLGDEPLVDPVKLFESLSASIDYFLEYPAENHASIVAVVACWVVMTYSYSAWDAVPYLYFNGQPGSGKSRNLDILNELCFRPVVTSSPSAPVIFRTLHNSGGTFLFDEAERLHSAKADETSEIHTMLLAGYKRGGNAARMVAHGDDFEVKYFEVFGPKAICNVNGARPVLLSRCIQIIMQRLSSGSSKGNRLISDYDWQSIRDMLHLNAIAQDWWAISRQEVEVDGLSGRSSEIWKPILCIAKWFEDEGVNGLFDLVSSFARELTEDSKFEQVGEFDEKLLRAIYLLCAQSNSPTATEILEEAKRIDSQFSSWSASAVGRRLKSFGLMPSGNKRQHKHSLEKIQEIATRYGLVLETEIPKDQGML